MRRARSVQPLLLHLVSAASAEAVLGTLGLRVRHKLTIIIPHMRKSSALDRTHKCARNNKISSMPNALPSCAFSHLRERLRSLESSSPRRLCLGYQSGCARLYMWMRKCMENGTHARVFVPQTLASTGTFKPAHSQSPIHPKPRPRIPVIALLLIAIVRIPALVLKSWQR